MFDKATRNKLRFESPKGLLSVEDLWDLPLTAKNGGASLDNLAKGLSRKLKDTETESFVLKTVKVDSSLQLSFDIVKHIIDIRLGEVEKAEVSRVAKEKKQRIQAIIAQKQDEQLKGASLEELQELANSL